MEINVTFEGLNDVTAWLSRIPQAVKNALVARAALAGQMLSERVEANLSGNVLQSRTGKLRNSIVYNETGSDDLTGGSVSVGDGVAYAAIQEYGGQTKAHIIEAVNGKALMFERAGKMQFAAYVNHPGSAIPERSYLRSAFDDLASDITATLAAAAEAVATA